jgi:putative transposase
MPVSQKLPDQESKDQPRLVLDELVREGARRMLQGALEAEVSGFLERHDDDRDGEGKRWVVRNGTLPERSVLTGAGPLPVKQPRVRDRRGASSEEAKSFHSMILPPYLRRSKSIDELIPWLYLKGISTGGFQEALGALMGSEAKGLSANVVSRLTQKWSKEHEDWNRRDLTGERYVYLWADGIYFNIRLGEKDRQCLLVLMGATSDGKKKLLGIHDGYRESEQSWSELLLDLKSRGFDSGSALAIGDGALGFWKALRKVLPDAREQRCWVHKTANVQNCFPKSMKAKVKADVHEIWKSATKEMAEKACDLFAEKYEAKYPKAVACLEKDREVLLTFYDYPAEHWPHLRTTNPIESTFATVRLRHRRTKGSGSRAACLAMVFKLVQSAEKKWRRLKGYQKIVLVLEGRVFKDGIMQERDAA